MGATVRTARLLLGLTQSDLAKRIGTSVATVSRLESGHTTRPRPALVPRLASALGADVAALLTVDGDDLAAVISILRKEARP